MEAYLVTASWNFGDPLPAERLDSKLVGFLERTQWIVDLDEFKSDPGRYQGLSLPEWLLAHPRAWLIVPLVHHNSLSAFLVLGKPRAQRVLEWEDYNLLKTR